MSHGLQKTLWECSRSHLAEIGDNLIEHPSLSERLLAPTLDYGMGTGVENGNVPLPAEATKRQGGRYGLKHDALDAQCRCRMPKAEGQCVNVDRTGGTSTHHGAACLCGNDGREQTSCTGGAATTHKHLEGSIVAPVAVTHGEGGR